MRNTVLLAIACAMALVPSTASLGQDTRTMKIRFTINGKELATATLMDNATAHDFLTLLPISLVLEDYAGTEKISYLPRKVSTDGAPAGSDPSVGTMAYYAPWGNLAIFYKDASYASGLVPLGRIDSPIEPFSKTGRLKVTIERTGK
jgi:hypothetical protein